MSTHVLLTGASGFIGFQILLSLLADGHKVRITARSKQRLDVVISNPVLQKLQAGVHLDSIIVPDMAMAGAFDQAMQGITHVLHVGSPVPRANTADFMNELYIPSVQMTLNILTAASKTPSVKRVVMTNSIVGLMPFGTSPTMSTPSSRAMLNDGGVPPPTFAAPIFAYVFGKIHSLQQTEDFMRTQSPHFSCATIFPSYIFGRNDLVLNTRQAFMENSSNGIMMLALTGKESPIPFHGNYAHIDDVVDVHTKALFLENEEAGGHSSFGVGTTVHYEAIYPIIQKEFPEAVAAGMLSKGKLDTVPLNYDASETEKVFGMKFRSFESAVIDVALQYLELLDEGMA